MKKICYLHIGLPKTGTTSIQENFYAKREEIEKKTGLFYYREHINGKDDPENIIRTISLALRYKNPEIKLHAFDYLGLTIDPADDKKHYDNLIHILENKNRVFLSAEGFCGQHKDFFIGLQNIINEYGFDIKVLLYVRNPYDFISSVTQQSLKIGLGLLDKFYFYENLKNSIDFWGNNLEIRRFEREFLFNNNLLDDICHWLGYDNIRPFMEDKKYNDSINQNACSIAYLMVMNNIIPHKKPWETHDALYVNALYHISRVSPSQNKFLFPKKLFEKNTLQQKKVSDYLDILSEYFGEEVYQEKILGDYDIENIKSIDERELLIILQSLGRENHQLREKIYKQKKITFQEVIKAVFSKKRRERLRKIR